MSKFLEVAKDGKWWKMNAGQRENHLKKLHSQALKNLDQPSPQQWSLLTQAGKETERSVLKTR